MPHDALDVSAAARPRDAIQESVGIPPLEFRVSVKLCFRFGICLATGTYDQMNFELRDRMSCPQCESGAPDSSTRARGRVICNRLAVLLLLVGLAGLAATAKDGQYHRFSSPERQSSLATKMNVPPVPVILGSAELQKVARLIASKPRPTFRARFKPEALPTESVGVTVAMQHRSPPESLLS
jgi:hypothetical protein